VAREPALDLGVIEEEIDRLVEAKPARHGAIVRPRARRASFWRGCSRRAVRP
jgi:hypothetical protein